MKLLTKKEIEIGKRVLKSMKKYKDYKSDCKMEVSNPKDSLDYNVGMVVRGIAPIEEFGEY